MGAAPERGKGVWTGPEEQVLPVPGDSALSTSEDLEVTLLAAWSSVLLRLGSHSPLGTRS